jgi:formylglycine-generating enzyme required for sulfatase activity
MRRVFFFAWFAGAFAVAGEPTRQPRNGEPFTVPGPEIALVWIAPGTFWMTNPHGTGDDTLVKHTRGFWLGRTEVTQAQWAAMARHIPVYANTPLPSHHRGSDRPVDSVSWDMAVLFCAKLNELERAAGRVPTGYEYTLPTEAQWEYAARAGTTGKYAGPIDELAWHLGNSGGTTHPVARKKPNAWGLYDMHGNVSEWCADWYGGYPGSEVADYAGPAGGVYRVNRGGGVASTPGMLHVAVRNLWKSQLVGRYLGFRLALAPVRTPAAVPVVPAPAK